MPQYQVTNVAVEKVTKGRNSYDKATVSYLDGKGQAKEKNVMSFSNPAVFSVVKTLTSGTWVDVEFAKDDPYFNWASCVVANAGATAPEAPKAGQTAAPGGKVLGNHYETRDERILRQLHIVRQSSLSNAVAALAPGAKAALKIEDVTGYAQALVDFVYEQEPLTLENMPDDIPY